MSEEENLNALAEAIKISPKNIPLRKLYAEALIQANKYTEAEQEYRDILRLDPNNDIIKWGLARVFYQNIKYSEAIILLEEICKNQKSPAEAFLLLAKLLKNEKKYESAKNAYYIAIQKNKDLTDKLFEEDIQFKTPNISQQQSNKNTDDEENEDDNEIDELGRIRLGTSTNSEKDLFTEIERPSTSFADVGGMNELKEKIRLQIIYPLKNPEIYKAYGKNIGGGILLYGAPGCGKTHIARAVAGEINASFISIGIQDVLDMWVGASEKNLHQIFESARGNKPCVLFFDEIDALAANRRDMRASSSRQTINQFLAELDANNSNNEGLLIIGATNAPWHIDSAFRRPGRFDSIIFVPPPDLIARAEILQILLKNKPVIDIDLQKISKNTENYSGADISAIINLAIESKLQDAMKSGQIAPITTKDLLESIKKHKPTTKEWFLSAKNHAMYANEGGLYDGVLEFLKIKKI